MISFSILTGPVGHPGLEVSPSPVPVELREFGEPGGDGDGDERINRLISDYPPEI